jgi:hypothetical protein
MKLSEARRERKQLDSTLSRRNNKECAAFLMCHNIEHSARVLYTGTEKMHGYRE